MYEKGGCYMAKMPMKWHEECLKNMQATAIRKKEEVDRLLTDHSRLFVQCQIYDNQITAAKYRKLDGFDQDRFLKKK